MEGKKTLIFIESKGNGFSQGENAWNNGEGKLCQTVRNNLLSPGQWMGITYWLPEQVALTWSFQRCGRAKEGHFPFHRNRTMKDDAWASGWDHSATQ